MTATDPLLVQGVAFTVAALTGVALGLLLDAYRAVRRALRPTRLWAHGLDVLLVVAAVPVLAGGMLAANWGEMRVYPLLALALGLALYLTLASPVLLPLWVWVLRGLARAARAVGHAAVAPWVAVGRAAVRAGHWAGERLRRGAPPPESDAGGKPGSGAGRANGARQRSRGGEGGGARGTSEVERGRGGDRTAGRVGRRRPRGAPADTPGHRGRRL